MTVYTLALLTIHDRDGFAAYERGFMETFTPHGGAILAVDENPQVLEGQWPHTRTVILSFPDQAAFDAWYHSDAYQAVAAHRFKASAGAVVVVKGFAPPAG